LTLQLFFDVTEGGADGQTSDVRAETNKIVALTRIEPKQGKPPVCRVSWGREAPPGSDFPFDGVVTNLTQNFVLFRASGEPVRANLTVVFTELIDPEQNKRETDPDLTTYVVKRGDTLSAIAARLYRDPTQWRVIAVANDLDDPHHLQIGVRLAIPKLI
jgi:nucleoid-associated protein YgaU